MLQNAQEPPWGAVPRSRHGRSVSSHGKGGNRWDDLYGFLPAPNKHPGFGGRLQPVSASLTLWSRELWPLSETKASLGLDFENLLIQPCLPGWQTPTLPGHKKIL